MAQDLTIKLNEYVLTNAPSELLTQLQNKPLPDQDSYAKVRSFLLANGQEDLADHLTTMVKGSDSWV